MELLCAAVDDHPKTTLKLTAFGCCSITLYAASLPPERRPVGREGARRQKWMDRGRQAPPTAEIMLDGYTWLSMRRSVARPPACFLNAAL